MIMKAKNNQKNASLTKAAEIAQQSPKPNQREKKKPRARKMKQAKEFK